MMITKEEVLSTLSSIYDGEYHRSVTELQLVRDIMIKDETVSFTFLLTSDDGADKERYRRDLIEALLRISVESPHIRFRAITEYERTRLEQGINNEGHEDNKALTGQQAH
ncbi:MAG: DUF59 domain-containing protein, partial [Gorillibacterium sp.]|nr:DUF59 domain-containing protein [Gorillibacterium sp.]